MLYAAKCYWPGVRQVDIETAAARFAQLRGEFAADGLNYRGTLMFGDDELVLCLFEGPSRNAVKRASEQGGIPCERVMDSVWIDPHPTKGGH